MDLLAAAAQPADPITVLLHVWEFAWPIASTIGGILAFLWAVVQAWPHIRRTFTITDVITGLPERLDALVEADRVKLAAIGEVKDTLDKHIADTAKGTAEWNGMKGDLRQLILTAEEVRHEVKHNGGTSIKDAVARIETAVTSPESSFVTGNLRLYSTQKGSPE